jgi:catechol 2,3-dioxygenase-like lactoylglutathione lyase family enzyme
MLEDSKAYSGFAVDDPARAREFYGETLGLKVSMLSEEIGLLQIDLPGSRPVLVYPKPDFTPATYTILNFPVGDLEGTVDELAGRGIEFERYEGFDHDERGIARGGGQGPDIAWFKDPAGNILSVHAEL